MAQKRIKVKPGKTQSKIGFGVGIVFVLIGIFIVIPIFGTFGIFWTAVAGFIAFSHYRNGFTDLQEVRSMWKKILKQSF